VNLRVDVRKHGALDALVRRRKTSHALAERTKIVLACAENSGTKPVAAVAARFGVSREMVGKWRSRFAEQRLEGLADAPGRGNSAPAMRRERPCPRLLSGFRACY
jgi:transposase-like protein